MFANEKKQQHTALFTFQKVLSLDLASLHGHILGLQFTYHPATMADGIMGIIVPWHAENARLGKAVIDYPAPWLMFYIRGWQTMATGQIQPAAACLWLTYKNGKASRWQIARLEPQLSFWGKGWSWAPGVHCPSWWQPIGSLLLAGLTIYWLSCSLTCRPASHSHRGRKNLPTPAVGYHSVFLYCPLFVPVKRFSWTAWNYLFFCSLLNLSSLSAFSFSTHRCRSPLYDKRVLCQPWSVCVQNTASQGQNRQTCWFDDE